MAFGDPHQHINLSGMLGVKPSPPPTPIYTSVKAWPFPPHWSGVMTTHFFLWMVREEDAGFKWKGLPGAQPGQASKRLHNSPGIPFQNLCPGGAVSRLRTSAFFV